MNRAGSMEISDVELPVILSLWSYGECSFFLATICDNTQVLPIRKAHPSLQCPEILLGLDHIVPTSWTFILQAFKRSDRFLVHSKVGIDAMSPKPP